MNLNLLKTTNPWWENSASIDNDPHLKRIQGKPYYFDNPIKKEIITDGGYSYILRGGRQVGKTTLLKEKIKECILSGTIKPQNCLFLSCEAIGDFEKLQELLTSWLSPRMQEPLLLCLDEITFVSEWQRALLWLINAGLLQNATTLITGSNARDLRQTSERFPGRHVKEINAYPLSINNYRALACFKNLNDDELLKTYIQVGGFPHAISDYYNLGFVNDETYETYTNWIFGDAHRFNLTRETLIHILFRILDTVSTQVTWQKLIETSSVKSHETAISYVEHLELAFLCKILHCYEPQKEITAPRKAKKIYFIDPLLYVIAGAYLKGIRNCYKWWLEAISNNEFRGKIFESIVVNHFSRKHESTYYWYSSNLKREIDLLIKTAGETTLFEVKSQDQPVRPFMGKNVVVITPINLFKFIQ